MLTAQHGRWWAAITSRLEVPIDQAGRTVDPALLYAGWPEPSGRPAAGRARGEAASRIAWPRVVVGWQAHGWAITAGLEAATVGVGLDGAGLTLAAQAEPVPQVVVRRTRPFQWSGFLAGLDPEHLLIRVGSTSAQDVSYQAVSGRESRRSRPLLSQWLITWDHTSWWRTTLVGSALAAPRRNDLLWPYFLQINVPLLDATWNEVDYGPVTDRIVSLIMEARWRHDGRGWWPAGAGRVWWEYGGEDFRPHDTLPLVPEISAPASLAGFELVTAHWDVAAEYLDTRHPIVLWYSNGGFPRGYSHENILLGHELGGGVEAWTAELRWRPRPAWQWSLRGRTAEWRNVSRFPSLARRREVDLVGRYTGGATWSAGAGWVEETVAGRTESWWRGHLQYQF